MPFSQPLFVVFGALLISFQSIATLSSDITILTPAGAQRVSFSTEIKQPHSRVQHIRGKHYSLSEMKSKSRLVKIQPLNAGERQQNLISDTSTKALVRSGLLKDAKRQQVRATPSASFSEHVHLSGQEVEVLLRRLTQRPLYHDRYLRTRQIALNTLMEQLGKPYRWGGTSPFSGFDCSGLIYFAYKDHIKRPFPRTARGMFHLTDAKIIRSSELEPGDLVFFQIRQDYVDHVGVYLGNNQFIQSPRTGLDIRISKLSDNYWQDHYVGARRVMTPDNIH